MTHIYARTLTIADVGWGHTLYYSNPDQLVAHLAEVQPTFFATVPRVLEKVFDKVSLGIQQADGAKKKIGAWALDRAVRLRRARARPPASTASSTASPTSWCTPSCARSWASRASSAVTIGGAALRADLARAFNGFGIHVLEGYGLTETSPVITNNLPGASAPGPSASPSRASRWRSPRTARS